MKNIRMWLVATLLFLLAGCATPTPTWAERQAVAEATVAAQIWRPSAYQATIYASTPVPTWTPTAKPTATPRPRPTATPQPRPTATPIAESQSTRWSPGSLTAAQGSRSSGLWKTVCGEVKSSIYASSSNGQPTFISLDRAYPNPVFTVVIWGESRSAFGAAPENLYLGQEICATGLIESYKGVGEMRVNSPTYISSIMVTDIEAFILGLNRM
jgi:hypothetical protein